LNGEREFSVYLPFALGSFYQAEQGRFDGSGEFVKVQALSEAQAVYRAYEILKDRVQAGIVPGIRQVAYAKVKGGKKPYYCAALSQDRIIFFKLASEKQQALAWDQYSGGKRRVDTWATVLVRPLSPSAPKTGEQTRLFSHTVPPA